MTRTGTMPAVAMTLLLAACLALGACGPGGAADEGPPRPDAEVGSDAASGSAGAAARTPSGPAGDTTRATRSANAKEATVPGGTVTERGAVLVRRGGRPSESPGMTPAALLTGELTVGEGGCLRVEGGPAEHLPIWPPGYSLGVEGNVVRVLDHRGRAVASVGDRVSFVGGETRRGEAGPAYRDRRRKLAIPDSCPGPLWGVVPPIRAEGGEGSGA